MLNGEKYRDRILEILDEDDLIAIENEKLYMCGEVDCKKCKFNNDSTNKDESCTTMLLRWMLQEYKPKLTVKQRHIVEAIGGRWIARDAAGCICVFNKKPYKLSECWSNEGGFYKLNSLLEFFDLDFDFITWADAEPWSIDELRKLEVIEE